MKLINRILEFIPWKILALFVFSGIIGYFVDVVVTLLFKPYLGVYFARIPAFLMAATTTWILNRTFTFGSDTSRHTSLVKEYLHYLSLMLVGLSVNYAVYATSITFVASKSYGIIVCVALGSAAGLFVNFITSSKYLFNKKS